MSNDKFPFPYSHQVPSSHEQVVKITMEDLDKKASNLLARRTNDMHKIKVKCWLYHAKSRLKNGNEPFNFKVFTSRVGKDVYIDYIRFKFINCDEFGGKEKAIEIVERWFN